MTILVLGLVLFLGVHSIRIVADAWRIRQLAKHGEGRWKGLYSVVSVIGFLLIVWGYGLARADPIVIWNPPGWTRHVTALLTIPAFILLVAAYVPRNAITSRLHHPMILGVKTWAFAHLLANGTLADMLLFGSFLAWAVLDFRSARRRDRAGERIYLSGTSGGTIAAIVIGLVAWALFAFWLHAAWIGVSPFGR